MYSYEANGRGNTSATDAKLLERKSQFINLPAVTPEDNGKVLGVNDGKWQPVNGGGGGVDGLMIVHATGNPETMEIMLDKTFEELHNESLNSAVMIVGLGKSPLFYEGETDEAIFFGSTTINDAGGAISFLKFSLMLSSDNSVEFNLNEIYAQKAE